MKKIVFILCFLPILANAKSVFYCEQLKGWDTLSERKIKQKICNSPTETETWDKNGCIYSIDGKYISIMCDNQEAGSNCIPYFEDDEKIEILCPGTVATGLYTISKQEKKIFYVKNGILNGKGYSMMMEAECK